MAKEFLGVGWKFPVNVDKARKARQSQYEEDVKEAIWIILSTAKGERVMRPEFGCGIHELVFAPISATTLASVENAVREALILWEPRIEVIDIDVSADDDSVGKLLVGIDYRIRTTNSQFNLVFPFYLTEGER